MLSKRNNAIYLSFGYKKIAIDKYGIEFNHKGDWVLWVWWWMRPTFNDRFLSVSFECYFPTLKSLDEMWAGYIEANNRIEQSQDEQ
jgi:hypothetical protein